MCVSICPFCHEKSINQNSLRPDTKKADTIFSGGQGHMDWLPDVIGLAPWRALIYELSERQPDCLMLNFAIKLISDAGFQSEISRVTTASHQLDIFSRVLCTSLDACLEHSPDSLRFRTAVEWVLRNADCTDWPIFGLFLEFFWIILKLKCRKW